MHLHGGLVDQQAAEAVARRLSGGGERAYGAPENWEQVYVVWRTGAMETLKENWSDLARSDRLYRALFRRLLSFASGRIRDGVTATRGAAPPGLTPRQVDDRLASGDDRPFADFDDLTLAVPASSRAVPVDVAAEDELEAELAADTTLEEAALDVEAALAQRHPRAARSRADGSPEAGLAALSRLDPHIRAELDGEVGVAATRSLIGGEVFRRLIRHGVNVGRRVFARYRTGRDHGLHATIAEEIARELYGDLIGSLVWGMMKGDARDHFAVDRLGERLMTAVAANPDLRLGIVAHSAGSIFASDMLIWAAEHDLPLSVDVAFLAPAVRTRKFAEALERSEHRIRRFRSFAMTDELERRDVLLGRGLGFVYPSSLLYLVSGLFEEHAAEGLADAPLVGMERFLDPTSGWLDDLEEGPPVRRVQDFLRAEPGRTVSAVVTGDDGLSSSARSHGGFDDEVATLASVLHFLGRD